MSYILGQSGLSLPATITSTTDTSTTSALLLNYLGYDGSNYTIGLKIKATSASAYYPYPIWMESAGYGVYGTIKLGTQNGLSFGSGNTSGADFLFGDQSVTAGTFSTRSAVPSLLVNANAATQIPLRLQMAASQSANAIEVLDSSSNIWFKLQAPAYPAGIVMRGYYGAAGVTLNENGLLFNDTGYTATFNIYSNYGNVGPYFQSSWNRFRFVGALATVPNTPSQVTSNQNNYAPTVAGFQRLSSDAARDITGLVAASDGEMVTLINVGSNNIVLKNESASSTAANRFTCSTGADITLSANQGADCIYDGTSTRWRVFKRN